MLRFKELVIRNFGPYKGEQSIAFAPPGKVTVVYGENMRGKTSLLNAMAYALTGEVVGRGSERKALHLIGNWEAAAEGDHGFEVSLRFDFDSVPYEINRSCAVRAGIDDPADDTDYNQDMFLVRDGATLGPEESELLLSQVMPRQVVRFFLFDAELLQEYEALLRDQSDMGVGIQKAIERILGVPILTNSRAVLRQVLNGIQSEYSKAASKNSKSEQMGATHRQCIEKRRLLESQILTQQTELRDAQTRKKQASERLKRHEKARRMLADKERLERERRGVMEEAERKVSDIQTQFGKAWLWALQPTIGGIERKLAQEVEARRREETQKQISKELKKLSSMSLLTGTCALCGGALSDDSRAHLELESESNPGSALEKTESGTANEGRLLEVRSLVEPNLLPRLESALCELEGIRARIAQKDEQIADVDENVGRIDESSLRKDSNLWEEVTKEIALHESGIEQTEEEIRKNEASISQLEKELDKVRVPEMDDIRHRKNIASDLYQIFDAAVGEFREDLRRTIEKDATRVFRELTTEPDYGALRINKNYGLTIIHKDGEAIPIRSAGAEHVVALSLISALQNNAPIHGPVVMDSPFGRLDENHKRHVVRCLPTLADQVTLLVYRSEVDPQVVREELKGSLGHEYAINRVSARHSVLELESGGQHGK